MREKWHRFGRLRVILPSIVLGIGAIFGLAKGVDYLRYSMKHVTTDDARVKGRMVSVAPEVSGMVKVLRVDEGGVVKAGDVLLELNDTTYRLQLEESQAQAEMIERHLSERTKLVIIGCENTMAPFSCTPSAAISSGVFPATRMGAPTTSPAVERDQPSA